MQLTASELAQKLESPSPPKLLDVREPEEHAIVHLPGSILIPLGELAERVDELEPLRDEEIVVYCHHGVRSLYAIAHLRAHGFTKLLNLSGGIDRFAIEVDPSMARY